MSAMYSLNLDWRKCNLYRPSVDLGVQGIRGGEDRGSVPRESSEGLRVGCGSVTNGPGAPANRARLASDGPEAATATAGSDGRGKGQVGRGLTLEGTPAGSSQGTEVFYRCSALLMGLMMELLDAPSSGPWSSKLTPPQV